LFIENKNAYPHGIYFIQQLPRQLKSVHWRNMLSGCESMDAKLQGLAEHGYFLVSLKFTGVL